MLMKGRASGTLLTCLRSVREGKRWFSPEIAEALDREVEREQRAQELRQMLTAREREVIVLAGRGLSNQAIAEHLGTARATVKVHFHRIREKVGGGRRSDIAEMGRRHGEALL